MSHGSGPGRGRGALDLETTVRAAQILAFKIGPLQCSEANGGEFHTLTVHFNNEKQSLQCTNNFFFAWSVAGISLNIWISMSK